MTLAFSCKFTVPFTIFADYLVGGSISLSISSSFTSILLINWIWLKSKCIPTKFWAFFWFTVYCELWFDNFVDLLIINREYECFFIYFICPAQWFPALHSKAPEDLASLRFNDCYCRSFVITERVELSRRPSVGASSEEKSHLEYLLRKLW